MKFIEAGLPGCFLIELEQLSDERGFFARSYCAETFRSKGLDPNCAQCNISFNTYQGTIRGMHFQVAPHAEAKLVRCTSGTIFDVVIDLRPESPSYLQHESFELSSINRRMLFIPEGIAHGFQTLKDNTEVFYQMSAAYVAGAASGVRYDDPAFNIRWPLTVARISEKDLSYAGYGNARVPTQPSAD